MYQKQNEIVKKLEYEHVNHCFCYVIRCFGRNFDILNVSNCMSIAMKWHNINLREGETSYGGSVNKSLLEVLNT